MKKITAKKLFLLNLFMKLIPTPRYRVWYLRKLGAKIGNNVRIHDINFLNAEYGFTNLVIDSDCYIGPSVVLDIAGKIYIGRGTSVSARVIILTHDDPGSSHNSPLCKIYPPIIRNTTIGSYCWIGVNAILLSGTRLGNQTILAAGSVAKGTLSGYGVYAGQLAVLKRSLDATSA